MVNVSKIRSLIKLKGVKISHVCSEIGISRTYFSDVEYGKTTMPDDRIYKVAEILGTTYEYLMDFTDDPSPPRNTTRLTHSLGTTNLAGAMMSEPEGQKEKAPANEAEAYLWKIIALAEQAAANGDLKVLKTTSALIEQLMQE